MNGFFDYVIIYFNSLFFSLSGAMMPGPVTTMTINNTISYMNRGRGWLVGFCVATGHALLEFGLMVGLWFGAAYIFSNELLLFIIGVVGGISVIILGSLGLKALHGNRDKFKESFSNFGMKEGDGGDGDGRGIKHPLLKPLFMGFFLSVTSSGWWLWWGSLGLTAINLLNVEIFILSSFSVFVTFYMGHISSDYLWFTFISSFVAIGKRKLNFKAYVTIMVCTNLFLIGLGMFFLVNELLKIPIV
ncbi:MAG: LysE family transporter [Promethearchaeota archaeon]